MEGNKTAEETVIINWIWWPFQEDSGTLRL